MQQLRFSWNIEKEKSNRRKHGVSFEEAKSVFHDEKGRMINDPDHSSEKDRFILLGMSEKARLLTVCHCFELEDKVIRIYSARRATKTEHKVYGGA